MPYLILAIGGFALIYGFYKFLSKANAKQIAHLIGALFLLSFSIGMLYLAATGRLHAAIAGVGALYPWLLAVMKWRKSKNKSSDDTINLDEKEALEILNLSPNPTIKDIEKSYKTLMKKHHPDAQGSDYFAKKLNAARQTLLDKTE